MLHKRTMYGTKDELVADTCGLKVPLVILEEFPHLSYAIARKKSRPCLLQCHAIDNNV